MSHEVQKSVHNLCRNRAPEGAAMRLSEVDFKAIRAKVAARKAKRDEKRLALDRQKGSKSLKDAPGRVQSLNRPRNTRKRLVAKLDAIFSVFIRTRGKKRTGGNCEICHKRPIEVCFHWVSRGDYATRWEESNCVGSCRGCNFEETFRKRKYRDIHIARVGEPAREALEAMARTMTHYTDADLILMATGIKNRLEALGV